MDGLGGAIRPLVPNQMRQLSMSLCWHLLHVGRRDFDSAGPRFPPDGALRERRDHGSDKPGGGRKGTMGRFDAMRPGGNGNLG